MEAEAYLAGGYGLRLSLEARRAGWTRLAELAKVWQPSRLKGIQLGPEHGTPFLAATQVLDLRPVPRKWLSLNRTEDAAARIVTNGTILVTCSGSVGRATLSSRSHERTLISHDLLRVEAKRPLWWGWLYAYLRSTHARAMMTSVRYGHIIKHLETDHLDSLPVPLPRDDLLVRFRDKTTAILDARNRAHNLFAEAEARFESAVGPLSADGQREEAFSIRASSLLAGRRRLEGSFHNPKVRAILEHFARQGRATAKLKDSGFDVWLPTRFKRIEAEAGVDLLDSSDLFEINPDSGRRIADGDFGDRNRGRVQAGWLLVARSGQSYGLNGSVTIATAFHENKIVSDHVIRAAPKPGASARAGYLYVAMSHPTLGRPLMKRLIYGSSIPAIDVADLEQLDIVRLDPADETAISDLAERASSAHATADLLENEMAAEAGAILDRFIAGDTSEVVASASG